MIDKNIRTEHTIDEILIQARFILSLAADKGGCLVEVGTFKGSSAAKLSLIAKLTGRKLYIFDSFKGLPYNKEPIAHTALGYTCLLKEGDYCGSLSEVKKNIARFGEIKVCIFKPGWIKDSLPDFKSDVISAFCDVDLACSTKECLKNLYPILVRGGRIFTHDAHIPFVVKTFYNQKFWESEVEVTMPKFHRITKRLGYFEKE